MIMQPALTPVSMSLNLFSLPNEILSEICSTFTLHDLLVNRRLYPRMHSLTQSQYFWNRWICKQIGFTVTADLRRKMVEKVLYMKNGLPYCKRRRLVPVVKCPTSQLRREQHNPAQTLFEHWFNNWSVLISLPGIGFPVTVMDVIRPPITVVVHLSLKKRTTSTPEELLHDTNYPFMQVSTVCVRLDLMCSATAESLESKSRNATLQVPESGVLDYVMTFRLVDYHRGARFILVEADACRPFVVRFHTSIIVG